MPIPLRPQLRPLNVVPIGPKEECLVALQDPQGFAPAVALHYSAALLAMLMDGARTLARLQEEFRSQTGMVVALGDLEELVGRLDDAYLLAGERFEQYRRRQIEGYLANPARPACHAGAAYAAEPAALREQLAGFRHDLSNMHNGIAEMASQVRSELHDLSTDLKTGGMIFRKQSKPKKGR